MLKAKKNLLFIVVLSLIILATVHILAITSNTQYIGVEVKNDSGVWIVSNVDNISWAKEKGILLGDIVSEVDQKPPSSLASVIKYGIIERIHVITISRNGASTSYYVNGPPTIEQIYYLTVIPLIVFTIFLAFSLFLYIRKRNDRSAVILMLFFISIGISYLSASGSSRGEPISLVVNRLTFLLCPVLFLHFLYDYFKRYSIPIVKYWVIRTEYVISAMMVIIEALYATVAQLGTDYNNLRNVMLAIFLINFFVCLFILITGFLIHRKNQQHKTVLKIMITGIAAAFFPFVGLFALPEIIFGFEILPAVLASIFLLILPVFFIYLITANRLLDIDFVLNRIRYYSSLSLFPSLIVFSFLHFLDNNLSLVEIIQTTMFIYLLNVVFLYFKENLDLKFRSKLFIEKYNFQASLDRFTNDIAKVMKVSNLEERVITEISNVLPVKFVCLIEVDKHDFAIAANRGNGTLPIEQIGHYFKIDCQLIRVGELHTFDEGLCVAIGENKNKYNMLWIGEKANRIQFNQDELVWLKTIAQYVSIVYENLYLIEGLIEELEESVDKQKTAPPWILRLLFSLSEKERRRLAADLHDSALQEQLLWYRRLETITSDAKLPDELKVELNRVREGLLDVIHQIRETCNELRPPLLKEIGIVEAIEHLVENAQLRTNCLVRFEAGEFQVDCNYEQVLAIYRIVQELLNNAAKHSKSTEIDIKLTCVDQTIFLSYQDNGIGMNLDQLQPSLGHIGLSGIKERVSSLEGETNFISSEGNGLQVEISMPAATTAGIFEQVM